MGQGIKIGSVTTKVSDYSQIRMGVWEKVSSLFRKRYMDASDLSQLRDSAGTTQAQATTNGLKLFENNNYGSVLIDGDFLTANGDAVNIEFPSTGTEGFFYYEIITSIAALNTYRVVGVVRYNASGIFESSQQKVENIISGSTAYTAYSLNVSEPFYEDDIAKIRIALTSSGTNFYVCAKVMGLVNYGSDLSNVKFSAQYTHGLSLEGITQDYYDSKNREYIDPVASITLKTVYNGTPVVYSTQGDNSFTLSGVSASLSYFYVQKNSVNIIPSEYDIQCTPIYDGDGDTTFCILQTQDQGERCQLGKRADDGTFTLVALNAAGLYTKHFTLRIYKRNLD